MRVFATRHGQVMPQRFFKNDMNFPVGDEPITDLGREQARVLGRYLKDIGFSGVIYASPYDRTMETASLISEELGIGFTPLPCLREMFVTYNASRDFVGLRPEEIPSKFPRASVLPDMKYPWWEIKDDTIEDVAERLRAGLKETLEKLPRDIDVLLVGHAATLVALREVFHPGNYESSLHWNLSLSLLYSSSGDTYTHSIKHIPKEILTANYVWYKDKEKEFFDSLARAEEFFASAENSKRVLHLGDTHSALYPYYKELIERLRPDVIVHTGDFADEMKTSRVVEDVERWQKKVPGLCKILEDSGAEIFVVDGNNDILEKLKSYLPSAKFMARNDVYEIDGKKVAFSHEVWKIDPSVAADIYLYGHGRTYETRKPDDNERDGRKYFNAVWGISLHLMNEDKHLILPEIML